MKYIYAAIMALFLILITEGCKNETEKELCLLRKEFIVPPDGARPGVYWYFMDGNLSKEGMTKDLESMKQEGIGFVVFLEVNVGVPRGKVDFLSDEWKECFKHAVKECERLGITMILGIGPGWTGSGGPWVKADQSMRHLVSSSTQVSGAGIKTIQLEKPVPKPPYFGEGTFTPELKEKWLDYYEDVAVLAFPSTNGQAAIKDIDEKALYYRAPYSSVPGVKQYIPREIQNEPAKSGEGIAENQIIDLTSLLKDGSITWDVPNGEWTIMRFGIRNNGAVTRPAPFPGIGFECDKSDTTALLAHLDVFTEELFSVIGERNPESTGGLKILHMDSWEMGAQNWAPRLREEFKKRRGYDPQPYFPVYAGYIVGNKDISERFLWDLRQTMQDLMLENHALAVKNYAARHGMQLSIEPYDMNPMQDLELGAIADIPMCEFWSPGGYNTSFSAIEGSSLANIKGQRVLPSEAFTASGDGWRQHPASMKNQTDWAFAAGINRLTYHTFQHQSLPDSIRPGMTMGGYGIHWDRNQTWWPYADAYHTYVSRCQMMLQYGVTVADVLYLAPEEAPFVFKAPASALGNDSYLPDKKGYNFDVCPPTLFQSAFMEDGYITFHSGMKYRLLVLPDFKMMTPKMIHKMEALIKDGAIVVGLPPVSVPGLTDYPNADKQIAESVNRIWGGYDIPEGLVSNKYGNGRIYWGSDIVNNSENLYPSYDITSAVLKKMNVCEDFSADNDCLRYIHKKSRKLEYYFVSNKTDNRVKAICSFRVSGAQPHLWDPVTGETRILNAFEDNGTLTTLSLEFDKYQSFFIVFEPKDHIKSSGKPNFYETEDIQTLEGPWTVHFDEEWGGPAETLFETLTDWSKNSEEGIKYYSGTASYSKSFDFNGGKGNGKVFLNLGKVKIMAKVWLNGKDLGIVWTDPWRVDITHVVKKGKNDLRIDVVNQWANRLIGDEFKSYDGIINGQWPEWLLKGEKRPSDRFTFSSAWHYNQDSPLLESGLMGPVTISKEIIH